MPDFENTLRQELQRIQEQQLYRRLRRIDSPQSPWLRTGAGTILSFSSNDYLGLANSPELRAAASQAIQEFGVGCGGSRLISGSLAPHHDLEEALAAFQGTQAALVFSSGYATALGTICSLVDREDIVILDKLVHASIVDAARLSGAKLRIFGHNDVEDLERILKWASHRTAASGLPEQRRPRVLIVTESVFSMDGDQAPLRQIAALKEQHGAWLMVDEAHATGLYGLHRRGLAEALGVEGLVEVHMGTLGKALGSAGGYICGSRELIDLLINRARSFVFSTAPLPAASAAAMAAVRWVQSSEGAAKRDLLWERVSQAHQTCVKLGWHSAAGAPHGACKESPPQAVAQYGGPIIPLMVGDAARAVELAAQLWDRGVFVPAIRYPTVARGQARLRLTVTAAHTEADLEVLGEALHTVRSFDPTG